MCTNVCFCIYMCFLGFFFGFFFLLLVCVLHTIPACLFSFLSYFILLYYYFEMTACIMIGTKNKKCGFGWVGSQGGPRRS